jgi:hypothetical protein
MNFHERKQERKANYEKFVKGWKLVECGACSGSSYYCGGPCGACDGTGKESISPKELKERQEYRGIFSHLTGEMK